MTDELVERNPDILWGTPVFAGTTDLTITEAGTVQFPMVRHATEIGWTPLIFFPNV